MGLLSSIGGLVQKTSSSLGNFINKGGGTFANPFLSVKGQGERLGNVAKTLTSAFTFGGVQTNRNIVRNETVAKILDTAASHPLITAGVAAGGITAVKYAAPTVTKFFSKVGGGKGAIITGGGAAAAVLPKASGLITQNKLPEVMKDAEVKSTTANSSNLGDTISGAIIAKTENPTIKAAASSLLNSVGGTNGIHRYSGSVKKVRSGKRRKKISRHKRSKHRKLKFGSKAFRKKYLHHKKHKKHLGYKRKHKRKLPKFGSRAWQKKFHIGRYRRK